MRVIEGSFDEPKNDDADRRELSTSLPHAWLYDERRHHYICTTCGITTGEGATRLVFGGCS